MLVATLGENKHDTLKLRLLKIHMYNTKHKKTECTTQRLKKGIYD